jgi:hypothetical protein
MAEPRFSKGDLVEFRFGVRQVRGIVKEDRGPIGVKGRNLYLVVFPVGADIESQMPIELPAVDMRLADKLEPSKTTD